MGALARIGKALYYTYFYWYPALSHLASYTRSRYEYGDVPRYTYSCTCTLEFRLAKKGPQLGLAAGDMIRAVMGPVDNARGSHRP